MNNFLRKWLRISFFNLLLVAGLGVIMRYKIAFYLPFIEQKHVLHSHSNFAFSGWVTQALMVLLVYYLGFKNGELFLKRYCWLLYANLITAYSMLVSFLIWGYAFFSISFSILSILVSYCFALYYWKDLNQMNEKKICHSWFKAALVFSVISSIGAFFITFLVANNIKEPNWYLASTYFFLHFQYNGWFLFACMGLFIDHLRFIISFTLQKRIFWLFSMACIPAYFLSVLWVPIPAWVYLLVVLAAAAQLLGWVLVLKSTIYNKLRLFENLASQTKWLFILSASALSIKLFLQLASTIPALSSLAFGFRPVVIGYLHLMFLGVITLFIIGFCKMKQFIISNRSANTGILIFVCGIILNEIF